MIKTNTKPNKRDADRAATVKKTAEIVGVSPSYVRMVLRCERDHEKIMEVFMELQEGKDALVEQVKKLIPFN